MNGLINPKRMNVYIDRLLLDGLSVPYHRQPLLRAAVETELGRLFAMNGLADHLRTSGAISHISANDIQLAEESSPARLGQQIARAVYEGVSR